MSSKRRVMVTIHHRGRLSLRENRTRLGRSAYHWGILIQPKNPKHHDSNALDVSDGIAVDPVTHRDLNPNLEWNFRAKADVSGSLLGRVVIGKVPNKVTNAEIEALLREVPLPAKDTAQNCVTWTMAAIQVLQKYFEVFVRETIARALAQKKEEGEADGGIDAIEASWLELEDLEKVAAGMMLDF